MKTTGRFLISTCMVLTTSFRVEAALISPTIDLTRVIQQTGVIARADDNYGMRSQESIDLIYPTNNDLNYLDQFHVEDSWDGTHGANSFAESRLTNDKFGDMVFGTDSYYLYASAESQVYARAHDAYYYDEYWNVERVEATYANSSASISDAVYFTLLQDHRYEYRANATYGNILLFFITGSDVINRLDRGPGNSTLMSGILAAGAYKIESSLSISCNANPTGPRVTDAACGGISNYQYELTLTPIPTPPAGYLLLTGMLSFIALIKRKQTSQNP